MKTHLFWLSITALFLSACGQKGGQGVSPEMQSSVQLQIGRNSVPGFDSLLVSVSGSNMETRWFHYGASMETMLLDNIPPGADRLFQASVFAGGGVLVQKGEAVSDIQSGETTVVALTLKALAGFLSVEIPLGLENASGVHSGQMTVISGSDHWNYVLEIHQGKGYFHTGALPLRNTLKLLLELYDHAGNLLFDGSKEVILASLVQTETLVLNSTRGNAKIVIQLANAGPLQLQALLPIAERRAAAVDGDLIFTEIFPWPRSNGDHFEYLELYNTTLDTLELDSCRIAKSRTTTGTTTRLQLPGGIRVLPAQYLVLGRDSALFADVHYQGFAMGNSGQELMLICGSAVLDSLAYALPGDSVNPFPLVMGSSLQLPLQNWQKRRSGKSWCTGDAAVTVGGYSIRGTPGNVADCQPD